jgi:two-component system chemotaxis response regulator CheB
MPGHDIIVIGASAGGVAALQSLVGRLPSDLPAALFVVMHLAPGSRSLLPQILTRAGPLPAEVARSGMTLEPGRIYVAPPDRHLLIGADNHLCLSQGPKENHSRPAIDPLFRSAALAFGPRVVGVVLTGSLDDGSAGLIAIRARGGVAIVQDPEDALYPGMPSNAIKGDSPDYCVPLEAIPALLVRLAREPVPPGDKFPIPEWLAIEVGMAKVDSAFASDTGVEQLGRATAFSCPECNGVLFEIEDQHQLRYRCRVGHAYSGESFRAGQAAHVETALWTAVRALEENAALSHRLAERARASRKMRAAAAYEAQAAERMRQAEHVRTALLAGAAASDEGR